MNLGVVGSGGLGVMLRLEERLRLGGRGRLDLFVPKGVWNCGEEEWVNKTFRVSPTEYVVPKS